MKQYLPVTADPANPLSHRLPVTEVAAYRATPAPRARLPKLGVVASSQVGEVRPAADDSPAQRRNVDLRGRVATTLLGLAGRHSDKRVPGGGTVLAVFVVGNGADV